MVSIFCSPHSIYSCFDTTEVIMCLPILHFFFPSKSSILQYNNLYCDHWRLLTLFTEVSIKSSYNMLVYHLVSPNQALL